MTLHKRILKGSPSPSGNAFGSCCYVSSAVTLFLSTIGWWWWWWWLLLFLSAKYPSPRSLLIFAAGNPRFPAAACGNNVGRITATSGTRRIVSHCDDVVLLMRVCVCM
jgi:hypothetical protein